MGGRKAVTCACGCALLIRCCNSPPRRGTSMQYNLSCATSMQYMCLKITGSFMVWRSSRPIYPHPHIHTSTPQVEALRLEVREVDALEQRTASLAPIAARLPGLREQVWSSVRVQVFLGHVPLKPLFATIHKFYHGVAPAKAICRLRADLTGLRQSGIGSGPT